MSENLIIAVAALVLFGTMFACMFALSYRLAGMLGQLTKLLVPAPAIIPVPPTIQMPPPPKAAPLPPEPPPAPATIKPSSTTFAGAPPWFNWLLAKVGFHETGNNMGIGEFIAAAHCGAEGQPWCAIAVNAALESVGVPGTRSPSSQSFRTHPGFVQLAGPALGAIVVFRRGAANSGLGHVGFYRGEDATRVWTLGGNEGDMVQVAALQKNSPDFGLIGYWWPSGQPMPAIGPILMAAGSPVNVQTPASASINTQITATQFGGQKSAYGGAIDDASAGVALPYHFVGERPEVTVTANGRTVDCKIVDVGPWNTNDPYWTQAPPGNRPQAESGRDMGGRTTNGAGIDLTKAAADAIQLNGKGLVEWRFKAKSPLSPTVT